MPNAPEKAPVATDVQEVAAPVQQPEAVIAQTEQAPTASSAQTSSVQPKTVTSVNLNQILTTDPTQAQDDLVVPESNENLQTMAKGKPESASTWWAKFFLRMIEKAVHFGRKIFYSGGSNLESDTNRI